MKNSKICIFWDSIVYGASDNKKGGWVNRLRLFIDNKIEDDIIIYNLGVPGDSTDELIFRFEAECNAREPEVIIFAIGINDTQYNKDNSNFRVPIDRFKNNILRLINIAQRYTFRIGFIGLTIIDETIEKEHSNINIKKYDLLLKEIAEINNLKYLSIFDIIQISDLDDGIHPNSKGHEKIYDKAKRFILDIYN